MKKLEAILRHEEFKMLLAQGKITQEMIAMLSKWRHSGFHVFCGNRISTDDETATKNLARYIIRASFSQARMTYLDQEVSAKLSEATVQMVILTANPNRKLRISRRNGR